MAAKTSIVFMDGIVQVRRTKGGYRMELNSQKHTDPRSSLYAAAEAIHRDAHPPLLAEMGMPQAETGLRAVGAQTRLG